MLLSFYIFLYIFISTTPFIEVPILNTLEMFTSDLRLKLTMPKGIDDRVVIADIDEDSIQDVGRWPWNRAILAELIDTLFDHYHIKVLGFDVVFSEPDDVSGLKVLEQLDSLKINDSQYLAASAEFKQKLAYDHIFSEAIKGRNIVLGMVFDQSNTDEINSLKKTISTIAQSLAEKTLIAKPQGYTGNIDIIHQATDSVGFFDNPNISEDGLYRKVPLFQLYQNGFHPSLALAITRKAIGDQNYYFNITKTGNYQAIEQVQLGSFIIPVDKTGSVTVPYRGSAGSFPYISVKNILNKSIAIDALKNRIIILGTSAPGLQDIRATPVDTAMPGVEVHANIISGILDQRIPYQPSYILGVELTIIIILGLLMMVVCNYLSPIKTMLFTSTLIALYLILNFLIWQQGIVIFLASPLLLIMMIFVVHMSWGFVAENNTKNTVKKLFGQYVPPGLVDEMVNKPEWITQEGQSRELTVLFADIRGFTAISESLSPKELSELLNLVLTPLTKVIYDERGTIDKYIGDCIMSFWGAPLPNNNHAEHGVSAALNMLEKVKQLQSSFSERGWPAVNIGIGLNTGEMSVGNMGSEYRMAYTVLGDAVNLAARVEGLTKQYGVALIVTEFTKQAAPNFIYRKLDQVKVKGKNEAVTIYEVVNFIGSVSDELIEEIRQFHFAYEYYCQQKWDDAAGILNTLANQKQSETNNVLYQLYLQRIKNYKLSPPDKNWSGVYSHQTK
ncbi:CHASE2 domain-containing protein [Colwellia polaris]|uniref:CHASE2 domain-containing protein n=1 Tax=Colwellia polaris TaxID=326537 RepID=UPI002FCE0F40